MKCFDFGNLRHGSGGGTWPQGSESEEREEKGREGE